MTPRRVDVPAAGRELLADLLRMPWGQVSPSVYETGRLVSLAPSLPGHARRLDWLVAAQRPAGGWGLGDGYSLVPTLSATEALLHALHRDDAAIAKTRAGHAGVAKAADAGLANLFDWLGAATGLSLPDLPAIELIVPALVGAINARLHRSGNSMTRLRLPPGLSAAALPGLAATVLRGGDVDIKLLHAAEVLGESVRGAPGIEPVGGSVGASPAATAAWLDPASAPPESSHYLRAAIEHGGGPVPCATPITVFERAWVLGTLARAGVEVDVPVQLLDSLRAALGPAGVATAPGLPPDADTTAATVHALLTTARPARPSQPGPRRPGHPVEPDLLWAYQNETHFHTWRGEQGVSTTVNAHVLEAFGAAAAARPDLAPRYRATVERNTAWLVAQQRADGAWDDRWHASPLYATAACAQALQEFGAGRGVERAVARARDWVLDTQRPDGTWGRFGGTAEETAYALTVLLCTGSGPQDRLAAAVGRGLPHLLTALDRPFDEGPALWHDKDLYRPHAIVRAGILAAVDLCQRNANRTRSPA